MEHNFNLISGNLKKGSNLKLGNFITIEDDVEIGDNVTIESYSFIQKGAKIGNNVFIGTYSKIGSAAQIGNEVKMTSYVEIRSKCVVGNQTTFGSRCTLSAGTIVGDRVVIKYGFVATDTPDLGSQGKLTCVLNNDSKYGANVVIMPGISVGVNAEIGACSQVRANVGDNEIWYGSPAKFYKKSK